MRVALHMSSWVDWYLQNRQPVELEAVLRDIQAAGYAGVEIRNDGDWRQSPEKTRRLLNEYGIAPAAVATGVTANPWPPNTADYQRDIDYAAAIGCKTVTVCGGFLPEPRRTAFQDDYQLFADNLISAMTYAAGAGVQLVFHNHTGCIAETIQEVEQLLGCAPELSLCIDVGHFAAVRCDAVDAIRRWPERVRHVHLVDWHRGNRCLRELGEGQHGPDFGQVLGSLRAIGYAGWMVVERGQSSLAPVDTARSSLALLRREGL